LELPDPLAARYIVLSRRMMAIVPTLGMPHTKAMGDGLFEFRLKGAEGIARVFYCAVVNRRIVMLHPDGHLKLPQLWPVKFLQVVRQKCSSSAQSLAHPFW